jgi:hypothetical protein
MADNVPNDPAILAHAQALIAAARTALATNDPTVLQQPSSMTAGAKVDAYCGVDGTGNPLPSYFGDGKEYAGCKSFIALDRGVRSAATPQDAVAFLRANETKINDLAAGALHRAEGIGAEALLPAETLVTAVHRAIRTNDASPLYTPEVVTAATHANSFCGVNT